MSAAPLPARNPRCATPDSLARAWFRLIPFRSPLLWELFRFLRVLRCFSSPTYLPPITVGRGPSRPRGCPIRRRRAHGLTAAPPSYRCWSASFVGWSCRGILPPRIMSCLVMDDSAVAGNARDALGSVRSPRTYLLRSGSGRTAPGGGPWDHPREKMICRHNRMNLVMCVLRSERTPLAPDVCHVRRRFPFRGKRAAVCAEPFPPTPVVPAGSLPSVVIA